MASYTKHGSARAQQRGIPPIIVSWLQDYGRVTRHMGADVYYFDKKSRKALKSDIGTLAYKRIADLLDAYAVVSDDGQIITAARRYKHLKS